MSIYYDKARELGELILQSDQAKMMADATVVYQNDEIAQQKMEEYKKYQQDVKTAMSSGNVSKEEITIMTRRLTEMAVDVKEITTIAALVFAENEFNGFVNNVMSVVKATIMGEESACGTSGGCESCSGCN